jgi:hypothetical protein
MSRPEAEAENAKAEAKREQKQRLAQSRSCGMLLALQPGLRRRAADPYRWRWRCGDVWAVGRWELGGGGRRGGVGGWSAGRLGGGGGRGCGGGGWAGRAGAGAVERGLQNPAQRQREARRRRLLAEAIKTGDSNAQARPPDGARAASCYARTRDPHPSLRGTSRGRRGPRRCRSGNGCRLSHARGGEGRRGHGFGGWCGCPLHPQQRLCYYGVRVTYHGTRSS